MLIKKKTTQFWNCQYNNTCQTWFFFNPYHFLLWMRRQMSVNHYYHTLKVDIKYWACGLHFFCCSSPSFNNTPLFIIHEHLLCFDCCVICFSFLSIYQISPDGKHLPWLFVELRSESGCCLVWLVSLSFARWPFNISLSLCACFSKGLHFSLSLSWSLVLRSPFKSNKFTPAVRHHSGKVRPLVNS